MENEAGTMVGEISKTFRQTLRVVSTLRGEIKTEFPTDIDVQTKVLLIGVTLLLVRPESSG